VNSKQETSDGELELDQAARNPAQSHSLERKALRFSRGSHTLASSATLRFTDSRGPSRLWQTAAGCARNGNLRKVHSFQDFGLFALALLQHRQRLPHDILGFAVSALFNRPADKFFLVGT
jgi:hypothetical protein